MIARFWNCFGVLFKPRSNETCCESMNDKVQMQEYTKVNLEIFCISQKKFRVSASWPTWFCFKMSLKLFDVGDTAGISYGTVGGAVDYKTSDPGFESCTS